MVLFMKLFYRFPDFSYFLQMKGFTFLVATFYSIFFNLTWMQTKMV